MKNILLVFGGVSYEHDISIVTAFQIYKKTRLEDIKLNLLYISRDGKFYLCDGSKLKISDFAKNKFNASNKTFKEVVFVSGEKQKLFAKTRFGLKEVLTISVAIFACHGGDGENGRLVTFFEELGIACSTGSSDALAVCMDKFLFKTISKGLRLPVVSGFKVEKMELLSEKKNIEKMLKRLGFPVIIKINSGGSSIGLFKAENLEDFYKNLENAFEFDSEVVVEKFIANTREFNIAVLGDKNNFEISEIDEPIKNNEILSFSDKYLSDGTNKSKKGSMDLSNRQKPLDLPLGIAQEIKKIAQKLFLKFGLYGVVRIDFLYDTFSNKIYICEVNTIPGSLAYYFYKKNKIITNDLVCRLIEIAERNFNRNKIKYDYMVDILSEK